MLNSNGRRDLAIRNVLALSLIARRSFIIENETESALSPSRTKTRAQREGPPLTAAQKRQKACVPRSASVFSSTWEVRKSAFGRHNGRERRSGGVEGNGGSLQDCNTYRRHVGSPNCGNNEHVFASTSSSRSRSRP